MASFRVIAKQAGAHKPFSQIFHHASKSHGISMEDPVQICASPHLDRTHPSWAALLSE
jgi:hypothetical protein